MWKIKNCAFTFFFKVTVYVSDQNDNAPWFQFFSPDKMTVMEDAPLGTAVGQVQMIDRDLGKNAEFEYAIRQANIGRWNKNHFQKNCRDFHDFKLDYPNHRFDERNSLLLELFCFCQVQLTSTEVKYR